MWGDGFGGLGVGMSLMVSLFSLSLSPYLEIHVGD
jgi:hypothetical protein